MRSQRFDFVGADGNGLSGLLDLPDGPAEAFGVFAHCFTCNQAVDRRRPDRAR